MPTPIQRLTVQQFIDTLAATSLTRRIDAVHVHHTFRPRRVDFRGLATIEAMRRFHMETNGWSDIAQHLTIDPTGHVWTGRDWNRPPASSSGRNGTAAQGPFMFEMIGDFDIGQEVLGGAQRSAAVDVIAALLRQYGLTVSDIQFHRDLGSPKTCPGTGVDKHLLQEEVTRRLTTLPPAAPVSAGASTTAKPFGAEHVLGRAPRAPQFIEERADAEVPEDGLAADAIADMSRSAVAARQARQALALRPRGEARAEDAKYHMLRAHVVNLSLGELSEAGLFVMKPGALEGIVEGIRQYAVAAGTPHVMLHAHGGLVGERGALDYALAMKDWWLTHGVYPVFFVWETGLFEILRQFVAGPRAAPRDVFDFTSDLALEMLAKIPGTAVWSGMKESARRASATDVGEGFAGGARMFAELLVPALEKLKDAGTAVSLHAVGHSAGTIFHAHLLPVMHELGAEVSSLSFLAPAIRVDLFKEKLGTLVVPDAGGDKAIERFFVLTMEEDAERSDHCWQIYRKSLLYFVSNSFEGLRRKPLLGLQQSIRKDAELRDLFGVDRKGRPVAGAAPHGTLYLSFAKGNEPSELTRSLAHGCFDNDPFTMSTVLRRIRGVADQPPLGRDDFPFKANETCGFDARVARVFDVPVGPDFRGGRFVHPGPPSAGAERPSGSGNRRALCVGINQYRQRPLAGCVADSRLWGETLEALGFSVTYLLDHQATRDAIVRGLDSLVSATGPGDIAVFQYAGHGSQVPDDDGDESDTFDEVFVPVDYHAGALLLDDDLAAILQTLQSGALMTLFMDCCHSGTNSRFAPSIRPLVTADERVRFLPLDVEVQEAHHIARRRGLGPHRSSAETSLPGVVHFAACQDDEFAWESAGQGDFTAAAVPRLRDATLGGQSNQAFLTAVSTTVASRGRQHPLLMPTDGRLSQGALLAPLAPTTAGNAGPNDQAGAALSDDAALAAQLEGMARLLRRRARHGA